MYFEIGNVVFVRGSTLRHPILNWIHWSEFTLALIILRTRLFLTTLYIARQIVYSKNDFTLVFAIRIWYMTHFKNDTRVRNKARSSEQAVHACGMRAFWTGLWCPFEEKAISDRWLYPLFSMDNLPRAQPGAFWLFPVIINAHFL